MFEWIELMNTSDSITVDLSEIKFVNGIDFTIPSGILLGPNERLVIPSNVKAFTKRYGQLEVGTLLNLSFLNDDGKNII